MAKGRIAATQPVVDGKIPTLAPPGQSERWSAACGKIPTSSPQKCPFPWFLVYRRVYTPNRHTIGAAVFAQHHTGTNTALRVTCVGIDGIYMYALRAGDEAALPFV